MSALWSDVVESLRTARARGVRPEAPGANLRDANLRGANLWDANLSGANLRDAGVVALGATPSGNALIYPTPDGWAMCVGCWKGSPDELRSLIDQEHGWPEASTTAERAHRRPYLALVLAHADLVMAEHPDLVPALAERWGAS